MPKKDTKAKLEKAKKKLSAVKTAAGEAADKKGKAKLRQAKKSVKRAQRKIRAEKVAADKAAGKKTKAAEAAPAEGQ